jgi:hypothetical protein
MAHALYGHLRPRALPAASQQIQRRWVSAAAASANPVATFQTTAGSFKAEIFLDRMPITASNFIDLAQTGFYEGVHFHRVIVSRFVFTILVTVPFTSVSTDLEDTVTSAD